MRYLIWRPLMPEIPPIPKSRTIWESHTRAKNVRKMLLTPTRKRCDRLPFVRLRHCDLPNSRPARVPCSRLETILEKACNLLPTTCAQLKNWKLCCERSEGQRTGEN